MESRAPFTCHNATVRDLRVYAGLLKVLHDMDGCTDCSNNSFDSCTIQEVNKATRTASVERSRILVNLSGEVYKEQT